MYKPSFFEGASDVFSVRHRKAPQSWGSAFGAGITYITWQPYTNRPLNKRGSALKKRSWEAPFFNQIQVVLVLKWRMQW